MIELQNPQALTAVTRLLHGPHCGRPAGEVGARELLHLAITGTRKDATPECATRHYAILPNINDWMWRDDAHRTAVIMPFLPRLAKCARSDDIDSRIAFRLADMAVRTIAAEAMEFAQLPEMAATLRALTPIVDRAAADAAYATRAGVAAGKRGITTGFVAAKSALGWAAESARVVGVANAACAAFAAESARCACAAADAAFVSRFPKMEDYARAMLGIICDAYGV